MSERSLQGLNGEEFAYLTTIGRKSGEPHRIEIWFGIHGDNIVVMSGGRERSDWVRNLTANPQVSVDIAGETIRGTAEVVGETDADDAAIRSELLRKYQKTDELVNWGRSALAIRIVPNV